MSTSTPVPSADNLLSSALADFWKLPHVEHDTWTMNRIQDMCDQAAAQLDFISEGIDTAEVKPDDAKKLRAFVRKWRRHGFESSSNTRGERP